LGQGGVKMTLVDRYGNRIYFRGRKQCWKEYRIIPIMKIHKFPYLNLNICEVVQEIWEVMFDGAVMMV
jgi:hypothetical protein